VHNAAESGDGDNQRFERIGDGMTGTLEHVAKKRAAGGKTDGSMGRPRSEPTFDKEKEDFTFRERFILRLFKLAEDSKLDNAAIAKKVGVSTVTVTKWLQGKNVPDLAYWPKLAKALGVTVRELPPQS
jgi:transcriptional regulator with XRE-family HTH domain